MGEAKGRGRPRGSRPLCGRRMGKRRDPKVELSALGEAGEELDIGLMKAGGLPVEGVVEEELGGLRYPFKVEEVGRALYRSHGLLTEAGKVLGCRVGLLRRYLSRFPELEEIRVDAREAMLDYAERMLFEQIAGGRTAELIFFLKTQGKDRGYVEGDSISTALTLRIQLPEGMEAVAAMGCSQVGSKVTISAPEEADRCLKSR